MHVDQKSCIYQSTVWIGPLLFILSAVFGGLSFVQFDLRWASILFLSLAVLDLLLFVVLRYKLKKSGGNTDICAFFRRKDPDSDFCIGSCFCDDTDDDGEDANDEENRRNETVQATRENNPYRASGRGSTRQNGTVRSVSQQIAQRDTEVRAKLRSLERHINALFRDYSKVESRVNKLKNSESSDRRYLVARERLQEKLSMVQDTMHREYRKLCRWYQGNDNFSSSDIEQAKERLRNVREHMKSIQRRIERIERTIDTTVENTQQPEISIRRQNSRSRRSERIQENRHSSISLTIPDTHYPHSRRSSATSEIVTLEVPIAGFGRRSSSPEVLSALPPPYQEQDPLPTMTQHYSGTSLQRQSSVRSASTSPSSSPGLTHRPSGMFRVDSFLSSASVGGVSLSEGEAPPTPTLPVIVQNTTTGSGALVLHLPRDVVASSLGLGAPSVGEAPPTYEEASSSQV